jgi:biopolymer transport protein ExbD
MNTGSSREVHAAINMTPMIDILLVLLIIFMAISPTHPHGINALVPADSPVQEDHENEAVVVLEINSRGEYRLNSAAVNHEELADVLASIYSRRASRVLFVKGSPELEFSVVAAAIDTARGVNIDRVAFLR